MTFQPVDNTRLRGSDIGKNGWGKYNVTKNKSDKMISSNPFRMLISSKYEFFKKIRQKELDRK